MVEITPEGLTAGFKSGLNFNFAVIGEWATYILISIFILTIGIIMYMIMTYKIKVHYFTLFGDPNDSKSWIVSNVKTDRAKIVKSKGVQVIKFLKLRFVKLKEVPYKFMYPDGMWMLRKSKTEFVPIIRPSLQGDNNNVILEPRDIDLDIISKEIDWDLKQRLQDEESSRKQFMTMMIAGIAILVAAIIVIWLSYVYHNNALAKTDTIVNGLNQIAGKLGIGG